MLKYFSLAAASVVAASAALGLFSSSKLDQFIGQLQEADALDVQFTVMQVGGAPSSISMSMQKPNKVRIDSPTHLVVADGSTITTFDKRGNRYTKSEQTDEKFAGLFGGPETAIWYGFFNEDAFKNVASVRDSGTQRRGAATYDIVHIKFDANGTRTLDMYLDQTTGLVKIAEVKEQAPQGTFSTILNTSEVKFETTDRMFAFVAPEGAKEVKESDLVAGKWYENFDEAQAVAKQHNKMMIVAFSAVWCGPCQMLARDVYPDPTWQKAAADFVLVKIDVDQQPAVARRFNVSAMPTIHFVRPDGSVAHTMMGYRPTPQFISEMETAKTKL